MSLKIRFLPHIAYIYGPIRTEVNVLNCIDEVKLDRSKLVMANVREHSVFALYLFKVATDF
jgi:hypothetical protein